MSQPTIQCGQDFTQNSELASFGIRRGHSNFLKLSIPGFKSKSSSDKLARRRKSFSKQREAELLSKARWLESRCPKTLRSWRRYALTPPFAYAVIAEDTSQKLPYYYVDELELTRQGVEYYTTTYSQFSRPNLGHLERT